MIPEPIQQYLRRSRVSFLRHWHPRAVSAQTLAESLHVTGYRVAKSVIVRADGALWIAVLPASEQVDLERLAHVLGVREVRLAREDEFAGLFPGCELGAEPPFGLLYDLPVVADESLARADNLLFRAGSHEEALEMRFRDFATLEWPLVAAFTRARPHRHAPPPAAAAP